MANGKADKKNGKKGKSKERVFTDIDANGIGTTIQKIKISDTLSVNQPYKFAATPASFRTVVAKCSDDTLRTLYLAAMRGQEASNAQSVRGSLDTKVNIGGKTYDLMTVPVPVAVKAINARMGSLALLTMPLGADATEEERKEHADSIKKMEKKEKAWFNASRMLVNDGKAIKNSDGDLAVKTAA